MSMLIFIGEGVLKRGDPDDGGDGGSFDVEDHVEASAPELSAGMPRSNSVRLLYPMDPTQKRWAWIPWLDRTGLVSMFDGGRRIRMGSDERVPLFQEIYPGLAFERWGASGDVESDPVLRLARLDRNLLRPIHLDAVREAIERVTLQGGEFADTDRKVLAWFEWWIGWALTTCRRPTCRCLG